MSAAAIQKAIAALPPEMQTLASLATATNATLEMQAEAAKSIVDGSPISALRKFVFHVIRAQIESDVPHAKKE